MSKILRTLVCTWCHTGTWGPKPWPISCPRCGRRYSIRGLTKVIPLDEIDVE